MGGLTSPALLSGAGSFFLLDSCPLSFLVSRHQHAASAASDSDFVTPEPRRTARRHPNTQRLAKKKKPQIVFSSDESSEEGTAGPEGTQPGGGELVLMGSPHPSHFPPYTLWALFLQCGLGLSPLFSESYCSLSS